MEFLFIWLYANIGVGFAQEYSDTAWKKIVIVFIWPVFFGARLSRWCAYD